MKRIPLVFKQHAPGALVVPGSEWVLAGEGVAYRMWHGAGACMVRGGRLYKHVDAGPFDALPPGFEDCGEPAMSALRRPGWIPVGSGVEDAPYREALAAARTLADGTYELCGPATQDRRAAHTLVAHTSEALEVAPRLHGALRAYLASVPIKGIVWHHPDGRMAKMRRADFGIPWPQEAL